MQEYEPQLWEHEDTGHFTKGNKLVWYGRRETSTTHGSLLWKCKQLSRVIKHQQTAAVEESMPFIYLFQKNTFVEFTTKVI